MPFVAQMAKILRFEMATSLDSTVVMENPGHLLDWPESRGAIGSERVG